MGIHAFLEYVKLRRIFSSKQLSYALLGVCKSHKRVWGVSMQYVHACLKGEWVLCVCISRDTEAFLGVQLASCTFLGVGLPTPHTHFLEDGSFILMSGGKYALNNACLKMNEYYMRFNGQPILISISYSTLASYALLGVWKTTRAHYLEDASLIRISRRGQTSSHF